MNKRTKKVNKKSDKKTKNTYKKRYVKKGGKESLYYNKMDKERELKKLEKERRRLEEEERRRLEQVRIQQRRDLELRELASDSPFWDGIDEFTRFTVNPRLTN